MANINKALIKLRYLDEQANGNTFVHKLHSGIKFIVTAIFIIAVTSVDKYGLQKLFGLCLYPAFLLIAFDLPYAFILKQGLWALPFVFFIGIFNPIIDNKILLSISSLHISYGWLSFFVILVKGYLCLVTMLLFTCTSGIDGLGRGLKALKLPNLLISVVLFIYRYIFILVNEVQTTILAYTLKSCGEKGVNYGEWGSLAGQILVRSIGKAQRIYDAMLLKGYDGMDVIASQQKINRNDIVYIIFSTCYIVFCLLDIWTLLWGMVL